VRAGRRSQDDSSPFQKDWNCKGHLEIDRKIESGYRHADGIDINRPSVMRLGGFVARSRMVVVLGSLYEVGMDEGRRMPMVVITMGMKERRSDQYLQHGHNAETRTKPSHQEDCVASLNRCQRTGGESGGQRRGPAYSRGRKREWKLILVGEYK
jgi:hypothetical protein